MSRRLQYQKMFSTGRVVNLGCGDCPVDFGPESVNVDMDKYNYKNFVQADIHNLPFKKDEFDTAVMGDVLEHCYDPVQAMREAGRVAKKVVATVFEEWRLQPGGYQDQVNKQVNDLKRDGFATIMDYYQSLPMFRDKIVEVVSDNEKPHHPHLHMFTEESLQKIVKDAGLEIVIFHKYPEGEADGKTFYNWLVVAKKGEK